MSADVTALVVGTILAVGALAIVLYPLFADAPATTTPRPPVAAPESDSAIVALREIEFDRATGKLSDRDYSELRARYGTRAIREMRGEPAARVDDDIEARVRAYRQARRECAACGLRPEPDAVYCSSCGVYLSASCPACSAPVTEPSAAFCSTCGATLGTPVAALV